MDKTNKKRRGGGAAKKCNRKKKLEIASKYRSLLNMFNITECEPDEVCELSDKDTKSVDGLSAA